MDPLSDDDWDEGAAPTPPEIPEMQDWDEEEEERANPRRKASFNPASLMDTILHSAVNDPALSQALLQPGAVPSSLQDLYRLLKEEERKEEEDRDHFLHSRRNNRSYTGCIYRLVDRQEGTHVFVKALSEEKEILGNKVVTVMKEDNSFADVRVCDLEDVERDDCEKMGYKKLANSVLYTML